MARIIEAPGFRDDSTPAPISPLPPNAGVRKQWRFRRNVVIYVAHRGGISQRRLADVFDLPRATIATILKEFDEYNNAPRFRDDSTPTPRRRVPRNATVGMKWRFRRNDVIQVAHRGGISKTLLADVFDLRRSRILEIVTEFGY